MDEDVIDLIHTLQIQQIDLNQKLMNVWSKMGDLISEILEINHKIMSVLKEEADRNQHYQSK